MKIPSSPTLIQRSLLARLKLTQARRPALAASLVAIRRRCGRPGCHCANGQGHPAFYLTLKVQGKTKTVYVPQDLLEDVQSWIQEHKRLKTLLQEISQLTLAQVQTHVAAQRRKAGRS
jgi:hypothetical protein